MAKKRIRNQNPNPFFPDEDDDDSKLVSSRKRTKQHQQQKEVISPAMSTKILKEAQIQLKEIQHEQEGEEGALNNNFFAFLDVDKELQSDLEEDFYDAFVGGFSDTQTQFDEEEIDEDDEKLLEAFLSKDNRLPQTCADLIVEKIKQKDAQVPSEIQPLAKLDDSIVDLYKGIGKFLNKYTAGRVPKAFKNIPSQKYWEDLLFLTEPEKWSPHAMFVATKIFASNLTANKAKCFYKLVLLPWVREHIHKHKTLHPAAYGALIESLYKPAAFYAGLLIPLCESKTCTWKEANIIGSVVGKHNKSRLHSSAALRELAKMEFSGTTSYFMKLIIEKRCELKYTALADLVSHFMRFIHEGRMMPLIWHQSLLAFVRWYKDALSKQDKLDLNALIGRQRHKFVTPEICRELKNSCNRGEEDHRSIYSRALLVNKMIEEDRFDIPEVPMEEG